MSLKDHDVWLFPTLFGGVVSLLRRFRRNKDEHGAIVVIRFCSHVSTSILCGYVAFNALDYWQYPRLAPSVCAVSGLFGSVILDWIEEVGVGLFTEFIKQYIVKK